MAARDAGAVGAMVMAGAGAGVVADLAAAAALVPEERRFLPDPARAALAERRFVIWQQLYAQLRPVNAGLQG
jgi:xylulokinase